MSLNDVADQVVNTIKDFVTRRVDPLAERVAALEKRINELERRPELRYLGLWNVRQQYVEGNLVTRRGSLWHANGPTHGEPGPGVDHDCWTLIVKRGRDGRDYARGGNGADAAQ